MRFLKNIPVENRTLLKEQLEEYKKEMPMTMEELRELEKWVASGRSPYDNGDYIYTDYGYPMDFVSAMRFQKEQMDWFMSLTEEEREQELQEFRGDYDSESENVVFKDSNYNPDIDSDAELPFG